MSLADRRGIAVSAEWLRSGPQSYALATAAVLISGFLRQLLDGWLGFSHPFIVFCPAIVLLALAISLGTALFATLLSAFFAQYFLLEPVRSLSVRNAGDVVGLRLFLLVGIAISGIGDQYRRRTQRLREFEKAIEGVQEMILVIDRNYRYLIANRMFLSYIGRKQEEVLGRTVQEIMGPDAFQSIFKPKLDECFKGTAVHFEYRYRYPQRGEQDIAVSYFPITSSGGSDRITVVLRDITEEKRIQAALRRREEDYRLFVERSSEGIFREEVAEPIPVDLAEDELIERIRRDSYVAECNDALARMYGFGSAQEIVGKRLADMLVPDATENLDMMRAFIRGGFQVLEHFSHEVDAQGNRKAFRNSLTGIVEDGKLVRTWGIQSDFTEQLKAEESRVAAERALKTSEVHFRELVEQASDGIFIADPPAGYTWT